MRTINEARIPSRAWKWKPNRRNKRGRKRLQWNRQVQITMENSTKKMQTIRINCKWDVVNGDMLHKTTNKFLMEPKVKCTPDSMRVEVPITSSTKNVYLQGLKDYPDPACKPHTDPSGSWSIFQLNLTDVYQCAITRVLNQRTGKQVYYQTIIMETTKEVEGFSQPQQIEEVIRVKCSISPITNHTVVKRNVLPAGFQEEEYDTIQAVEEKAPTPILGVGVRQDGKLVTGELNVPPGTRLQMEIFLDKNSSVVYGLLVTHMQVTDTKTQEETIIYNGCSVDPFLFGNFNTTDGDFLTAKFRAFKFPESNYVQFKGTVNVCLDKCKGVECSDGQIGFGRKRREVPTLPPDPNKIFEITITSFIKVNYEDESENFEEIIKNQTKIYNNKKFIVGNQVEKRFYRTDEVAPSNLGITKLTEEEQISSIVSENSAAQNSVMLLTVCFGLILRLFL
ncbi:hypothetical protein ILUMI_24229 [Ignelater luminosus]|uniref:ZP domain-containing protein n=1 Tax=Ignelater luminosus TaxID=2038154 RepID=A0A8K0CCZ9_IGNLU|nr:hypothetical protein ILUMI_24229 [Ignelater luminosus]